MKKYSLIALLLFLFQAPIFAAGDEARDPAVAYILGFSILLIVFVLWLALVYSEKNDAKGEYFLRPLIVLKDKITKATPLDREKEILMDHDYDGIKELDNPVPPWFNFLFYGTITFGIIYLIYFHIVLDWSSAGEYNAEMEQAAIQKEILIRSGALVNEETVTRLNDVGSLTSGKEIFLKNCATCHGKQGEGLVGPNLTDEYWLHGGGIKNVFKTIKYGVPQKGMISWENQLGPKKIQEVASYILSLQGTNPPNAKAPQGEKYTGEKAEESQS
ncbi:MAG: cytochrome oxidase subunit III [Ignavibacteria bacterium]|nr:MAG: cytochrome oxidase subunit III [Ignavibacteria bacterium]